nr:hypothetical protein P9270_028965 [Mesorhizobium sp. WSM4875]
MSLHGVLDSNQLEILSKAVHRYCSRHGLESEEDRQLVAMRAMSLFGQGTTDLDRLSARLEKLEEPGHG